MDVEIFTTMLMGLAQSALPYIGAGVVAALVVFAVVFGIRAGKRALSDVSDYESDWRDDSYGYDAFSPDDFNEDGSMK